MARAVYLEPHQQLDPPIPFRTGEAGVVRLLEAGLQSDTRVRISANALHALYGHGVVDQLDALALEGRLASGLDVLVPHAELDQAARVLYAADRTTYGRTWEFVVERLEGVEYRVRVDNREYQRTLLRLTDLISLAGRDGHAVRLRL